MSTYAVDPNNSLDPNALADLKRSAASGSAESNQKIAQQFEGMFLNLVMKNMRESLPQTDMLGSDATRMAQGLYDQQITQKMASNHGIGLATALVAQMNRTQAARNTTPVVSQGLLLHPPAGPGLQLHPPTTPLALPKSSSTPATPLPIHKEFVDKYHEAASQASQASGIPTKVILGQAALESGWGKHEARDASGTSHNLFGIKAGPEWTGATVSSATTEFINGVAQTVVQKFRAYASYAESFLDYAHMLASNPRYAQAAQVASDPSKFSAAMGHSGYATDPSYAQKLASILTGPLRNVA